VSKRYETNGPLAEILAARAASLLPLPLAAGVGFAFGVGFAPGVAGLLPELQSWRKGSLARQARAGGVSTRQFERPRTHSICCTSEGGRANRGLPRPETVEFIGRVSIDFRYHLFCTVAPWAWRRLPVLRRVSRPWRDFDIDWREIENLTAS